MCVVLACYWNTLAFVRVIARLVIRSLCVVILDRL